MSINGLSSQNADFCPIYGVCSGKCALDTTCRITRFSLSFAEPHDTMVGRQTTLRTGKEEERILNETTEPEQFLEIIDRRLLCDDGFFSHRAS